MFRKILPRVWICWILVNFASTCGIHLAGAHSCHEVQTVFQLRQIGLLRWVPETAATDADLQICKHQGPTCCNRKMEESYHAAVRRDILQNILSYSVELKYLILGHVSAYHETFHSLLSFALNHTLSLFDLAYEPIAREARPLVTTLYSDLALYLHGYAGISIESSVHRFYDDLFPLVYRHLVNPGLRSSSWSAEGADCLRATRPDINPFGPHPQALAQDLSRALVPGRALSRALVAGTDILNTTESANMATECGWALVRMQYCSHCRGLTLIRPCGGLCLNVMRGCLAGLAELQAPWSRYVVLLEQLSAELVRDHRLELALLGIRERINNAILSAQLHGPHLSAVVDKVCGPLTELAPPTRTGAEGSIASTTGKPHTPDPSSSPVTGPEEEQHSRVTLTKRSLPLKPSKNDKPQSLKKISKEFKGYIQRYKTFFSSLPELLCEGETVVDEHTCWSGQDVVENYTGRVVASGLQAQRHNPEMKVRRLDPTLVKAKERLEQFIQAIWLETGLGMDVHKRVDADSGSTMETSGECDDEDGCQGSGEDEDAPEPKWKPGLELDTSVINWDTSGNTGSKGGGGTLPSVQPPVVTTPQGNSAACLGAASTSLLLSLSLLPLLLSCLGPASA